jgi:hypothetical protein
MIVFLRYLFGAENLKTYCRDEWIKVRALALTFSVVWQICR